MPNELEGRVALVTGGSRGIGRSIALRLAARGCRVAVNYQTSLEAATQTVAAISQAQGTARAYQADLTCSEQVSLLVAAVKSELGPVDILINNAGIAEQCDVFDTNEAHWDRVLAANLKSAFSVTQQVIADMRDRRWGRLIFLSSLAARTGGIMSCAYAASKAGLEGLAHYYATELLPFGITSNAIAPAAVATDMYASATSTPVRDVPMGRHGQPDEVASVADMLVCNGYITGQTIHVNAGRYMT